MEAQSDNEHEWFGERIGAYLAGGLGAADAARFREHAGACSSCAAALSEAAAVDAEARKMFENVMPDVRFEDRVIERLREGGVRRRIVVHPLVGRAAAAAAAVIVLGLVGYRANEMMDGKGRAPAQSAIAMGPSGAGYRYASPRPDTEMVGGGYKKIEGLEPTFVVGADISRQPIFQDRILAVDANGDGISDVDSKKFTEGLLGGFTVQPNAGDLQKVVNAPTLAIPHFFTPGEVNELGGDRVAAAMPESIVNVKVYNVDDLINTSAYDSGSGISVGGGSFTNGNASIAGSGSFTNGNASTVGAGSPSGVGGTGGGTGGGNDGDAAAAAQVRAQQIEDLEKTIQNTVASNTWKSHDPNGDGQVDTVNGQIVITATPEVQAKINDLLAKIRTSQMASPLAANTDASGLPNTGVPGALGGGKSPPPGPGGQAPAPAPADASRKVIRNGEMTFEVDSFDSAAAQIGKIVGEERGFVATTNSDKLDNGKVTGVIVVRVPPDHLDTLILKLRGLGDLKGQKIGADDITRQYTDLQSELRAAQAMQDRLLDLIKNGKGEVKDLVEAENELGTWREKVEQVTGEINYYNNLVALSTLKITLSERDIQQAAAATEVETVAMGIETEDVVKSRVDALKQIEDIKGRIIQSDLKQFEAGQLAAQIVADVPPDAAGPLMDRLKQLGRVARLDIGREQSAVDGAAVPAGVKVERKDTRLTISIYNLANIAPRQTTTLNLASADVEKSYRDTIARVLKAGGRIVNSTLSQPKSDQIDAAINFETPSDQADIVLQDIRGMGDVMHLSVAENPDAANVTSAKRGFTMTLISLATVPPRQTITRALIPAGPVAAAYNVLLAAAQEAGGRITTAQLQETGEHGATAQLVFDIPQSKLGGIEKAMGEALGADGKIVSHQTAKSADTEHTVESKVGLVFSFLSSDALAARLTIMQTLAVPDVPKTYGAILAAAQAAGAKIAAADLNEAERQNITGTLQLIVPQRGMAAVEKAIAEGKGGIVSRQARLASDLDTTTDARTALVLSIRDVQQLPPRQSTMMRVQSRDPEKELDNLRAATLAAGGRIIEQQLSKDGDLSGHIVLDVPLNSSGALIDQIRGMGVVKGIDQNKDPNIPDADFARAHIEVTFVSEASLVGEDSGLWATLQHGLGTSIKGLLFSLDMIVIGLCLILPWALVIWGGRRVWRKCRMRNEE